MLCFYNNYFNNSFTKSFVQPDKVTKIFISEKLLLLRKKEFCSFKPFYDYNVQQTWFILRMQVTITRFIKKYGIILSTIEARNS